MIRIYDKIDDELSYQHTLYDHDDETIQETLVVGPIADQPQYLITRDWPLPTGTPRSSVTGPVVVVELRTAPPRAATAWERDPRWDAYRAFCPACGEPSLAHHYRDTFTCRSCHRAGEVSGFDQ
jgi:hypothetical protein